MAPVKIVNFVLLNKYTFETLELLVYILIIKIQVAYDFKCIKGTYIIYTWSIKKNIQKIVIIFLAWICFYIIRYISNWQVSHTFPGILLVVCVALDSGAWSVHRKSEDIFYHKTQKYSPKIEAHVYYVLDRAPPTLGSKWVKYLRNLKEA